MEYSCRLWLHLLLLLLHKLSVLDCHRLGSGLMCNYCYSADLRADCHINVLQCAAEHVCSVETSVVTYRRSMDGDVKTMMKYRMGCEHYSLCRDRVVSGPGPSGYSVTTKICCCNHLCEEPDGVGEGQVQHCPSLWQNYTQDSGATRHHGGGTGILVCLSAVVFSIGLLLL